MTGSTLAGWWLGNHAVKLSWLSGMSLGIASPANRSGITVRYPARAYESASLEHELASISLQTFAAQTYNLFWRRGIPKMSDMKRIALLLFVLLRWSGYVWYISTLTF
ncbi:hypothetical protein CUC08_Gglean004443 [Alternaria sp. MG1]|nr:hypothetical protein CUC08_Gglean004443 [Alternaria sp. MG1]